MPPLFNEDFSSNYYRTYVNELERFRTEPIRIRESTDINNSDRIRILLFALYPIQIRENTDLESK